MLIEFLDYQTTPLGILCLRRREISSHPGTIITEVTLNHEFLMSSFLTESERALANRGMDRIGDFWERPPGDIRVLVGGLGLGYTAAEALKSERVGFVEVVEFLPEVIGWTRNGLIPLSAVLNQDSRLKISGGDIYSRLNGPAAETFDLVIIDVDHSPEDVLGEQSNEFYSRAGMQAAGEHLAPGGVLGIWSYAEDSPLLAVMQDVFDDVAVEQVTAWNGLIHENNTDWLFFGRRRKA